MVVIGCAESTSTFWSCVEDLNIQYVRDFHHAVERLRGDPPPLICVIRINDLNDFDLSQLASIRNASKGLPIVAWIADIPPDQSFRFIQMGFDGLVTDQTPPERRVDLITSLRLTHEESLTKIRRSDEPWRRHLVGGGPSMAVINELIRLVSPRRCTVLITGETGSGKEMVARAIHQAGSRATQPLVSINCNAIPAELLEAELFGHVKGAFTGAFQNRIGRFEQAHKGTLFLDEIGDMPFSLQAKLLRVLQEREIQRLGSSETVKVDVRVIAATNANLHQLVAEGKFRQDLFYRLHVAPIHIPPLRERSEDIPVLAAHLVEKICRSEQIPNKAIPREILERFKSMPWPGNVRELENTIESAIAVSGDRSVFQMLDFPALLGKQSQPTSLFAMPEEGIDYNAVVSRFERILLGEAMRISRGSKKHAASFLRLKRSTFSNKLDVLGMCKDSEFEDDSNEIFDVATCRS